MVEVMHPKLHEIRLEFQSVAIIAKASELNRHVVRVQHGWTDDDLATHQGQSELIINHILHGGVGPLSPEAEEFLRKIESQP